MGKAEGYDGQKSQDGTLNWTIKFCNALLKRQWFDQAGTSIVLTLFDFKNL